jgi:hypothetical protein
MSDFHVIRDAKTLARALRDAFPDGEEAFLDSIEGEGISITDALYRTLLSAEENRTFVAALSTRISELEERRSRIEATMEKKRAIVFGAMIECGIKKIDRDALTASVVASPVKCIVTDETALADEYVRVKREPAKSVILAALKDGREVAGATLSNPGQHLMVKRS